MGTAVTQPAKPAAELRLILGDQLHSGHPWLRRCDTDVVYVLMEVRQETDYVRHHGQKILAIFGAMRAFAASLQQDGHRVHYLRIGDADNRQQIPANLLWLAAHYGAQRLRWQMPDEWRLDRQLQDFMAQAEAQGLRCRIDGSAHFYTPREFAAQFFAGRKHWLMESFYREMRRRHQVLLQDRGFLATRADFSTWAAGRKEFRMEWFYREMRRKHGILMEPDGQPSGGTWNFDHDNRKAWRGKPAAAADTRPSHDLRALWQEIQAAGVPYFGQVQPQALRWPLTRAEALQQLQDFIWLRLPFFGDFQDAMSSRERLLFHSLLSFALNIKLLTPQEVVAAAEAAARQGHAPLPAVEGFIRQILGWREYVRGVYWAQMPGYTDCNQLQHDTPLPAWFWHGETGMRCLHLSLGQSLEDAYAHHIQRLMVIGNFALLAGIVPQQVHAWYLGVYIDAFEWVEAPNTLGMSQFADGGLLASKPYVSSAAYLKRMGDYCQGCKYDPAQRSGPRACPFNSLYWDFFARHAPLLEHNPRLALVYRQLRQMAGEELDTLRAQATQYRQQLDQL